MIVFQTKESKMAEASVNGVTPHFPQNESEAEEMFIEANGRDPESIKRVAKESYDAMMAIAEKLEKKKTELSNAAVVHVGETTKVSSESETSEPSKVIVQRQETKIETTKSEVKHERPSGVTPPPGYMELPEGLFVWSPDIWGGRPLFGVPDRVVEKADRPTQIVFILVAPAFGRNRQGKIVSLPEGSKVVVNAGVAWGPMIPVAKGPEGRPVIWAAPTAVDSETMKVRIANVGEKLHTYETADGGREYGLTILYDPDPKDPSKPRLISLETLRGVNG
jgi:hypothetical protein